MYLYWNGDDAPHVDRWLFGEVVAQEARSLFPLFFRAADLIGSENSHLTRFGTNHRDREATNPTTGFYCGALKHTNIPISRKTVQNA